MSVFNLLTAGSAALASGPVTETSPFISALQVMLPIVLIFYFFMLRPNQKKISDFNTMIKSLRRGDKIVTGGGIIGTIHKLEGDDILVLEIAPDIKIRVMRDTISQVISKTVANDNKAESKSDDKINAS